jgi:hypothetical protein
MRLILTHHQQFDFLSDRVVAGIRHESAAWHYIFGFGGGQVAQRRGSTQRRARPRHCGGSPMPLQIVDRWKEHSAQPLFLTRNYAYIIAPVRRLPGFKARLPQWGRRQERRTTRSRVDAHSNRPSVLRMRFP